MVGETGEIKMAKNNRLQQQDSRLRLKQTALCAEQQTRHAHVKQNYLGLCPFQNDFSR